MISVELIIAFFQQQPIFEQIPENSTQFKANILIPAHNEAEIIKKTISHLLEQDVSAGTITVVADNCTDATADIAKQLGVNVLERSNQEQRGKGYALDHGITHLKSSAPFEVLLILDADCEIDKSAIEQLVYQCGSRAKPQQALYLMESNNQASLKQKVAGFAWLVKNKVRPIAIHKLGVPVTLTGTGMAFPWSVISAINVAHGNIVEDMQLGIDCTLAGAAPEFCQHALVCSQFPEQVAAETTQRTRWEHGHLLTIMQQVPMLLKQSVKNKDWRLLLLALDIGVPPLALLVLLTLTGLVGLGFYGLIAGKFGLFYFLLSNFSFFAVLLMLTWWRYGREYLTLKELASIPVYIFSKLSVYSAFLFKRQTEWVRTSRERKK